MALDQRLINPLLPDDENSKVNACVSNVFSIWDKYRDKKSTQLVFCDMSIPNKDGFNAVSYTHLDVYKRQQEWRWNRSFGHR